MAGTPAPRRDNWGPDRASGLRRSTRGRRPIPAFTIRWKLQVVTFVEGKDDVLVTRRRSVQASAARLRPVGGARVRPTCESGRGSETESALARGRPPHSHRPASPSASRCIVRQGGQGSKACRGTSRSQWPTGRIAVSSSGKGSRRRPASNPRHGPPTRRSWWSFGILAVVIAGGVVLNRVLTGREDGAGTEPGGYPNIQRAEPGAH